MGDKKKSLTCLTSLTVFAVFLLLASIAISAVILVHVLKIYDEGRTVNVFTDDASMKSHENIDINKCHDIAIVGAGVGGSYTAYKLRNKSLDIAIYEQLDRVGGRIFSVSIPGVDAKAEMGGMRLLPSRHPVTAKQIEELGIETREFTRVHLNDRVYHLRGHHFTQPELLTKKLPYELRDNEVGKYMTGLMADANKKIFGTKQPDPYRTNTTDGVPLWKLSYVNEVSKVLSSDAIRYSSDVSYFDDDFQKYLNADFHWHSNTETEEADIDSDYLTVTDGMQTIATKTVNKFLEASEKHSLHLNSQIRTLEVAQMEPEKIYQMKVKDMKSTSKELKTVCAKKVILALPTPALKRIYWQDTIKGENYVDYVDAVIPVAAFKTFFAYDSPWWRTAGNGEVFSKVDNMKHFVTDLPTRQTFDMEAHEEGLADNGKTLLLASYACNPSAEAFKGLALEEIDLFEGMVKSDPGQYSNKAMVELVNNYFSRMFNISVEDLPQPYAVVSQHWGHELHGAGWHFWNSGYKWEDVVNHIVKPGDKDDIFICGEAFSPHFQGWIEGAFEVCDVMLSKYFDV